MPSLCIARQKPVIFGATNSLYRTQDNTLCRTHGVLSLFPRQLNITRSPASAGIANRPLVFVTFRCRNIAKKTQIPLRISVKRQKESKLIQYHIIVYMIRVHNIEYLCVNLFTFRRFNNKESSGGRQILLPLLGGDAPRLGW